MGCGAGAVLGRLESLRDSGGKQRLCFATPAERASHTRARPHHAPCAKTSMAESAGRLGDGRAAGAALFGRALVVCSRFCWHSWLCSRLHRAELQASKKS